MEYRSDIGLALTKEGSNKLQEKLNSLDKSSDIFSNVTTLLEYTYKHQKHEESGAELFLWDYLKWYDSFPEVRFFEELMNELEDDDFLFLRIGERYERQQRKRELLG